MTRSVIVSGPPAVGKTTVAVALAREFGLTYVSGGDVLKEIAAERGFDSRGTDWWDTEEGMKFLAERVENPEFDRRVDARLKEIFDRGGAVITSYTLPWLVSDGVKIWLAGSHENSAMRMQNRDKIGREEAYEITKIRYEKNKSLYKELYGFRFGDDITVFDIVIETDDHDAGEVIKMAKMAAKKLL